MSHDVSWRVILTGDAPQQENHPDFENRKRGVSASSVAEIRYVLEKAGVEFTNGAEQTNRSRPNITVVISF
jgi:hypothetical protein